MDTVLSLLVLLRVVRFSLSVGYWLGGLYCVSLSLSVGGGGRCNSIQLDPIPQHVQDQTAKQRERGKTRTKRKERVGGKGDARLPNGKVRHLNVQLTKLLLGQFIFPPSTQEKRPKKIGPSLLLS